MRGNEPIKVLEALVVKPALFTARGLLPRIHAKRVLRGWVSLSVPNMANINILAGGGAVREFPLEREAAASRTISSTPRAILLSSAPILRCCGQHNGLRVGPEEHLDNGSSRLNGSTR